MIIEIQSLNCRLNRILQFRTGAFTLKTGPGWRPTSLKTRHNCELWWDLCRFSVGRTLDYSQKSFKHIYCFIFELDTFMKLRHIWNIFIATSLRRSYCWQLTQSIGKLRRVKVHSHGGQWRRIVTLTHSSPWMRQLWEWCISIKDLRGKILVTRHDLSFF